jgi:hypothetical protein
MPDLFTLEDQIHHAGELDCPGCADGYPEPCACEGLVHASESLTDADTDVALTTRCDRCGRSEGDLAEHAA